jgi:hypothetical protein
VEGEQVLRSRWRRTLLRTLIKELQGAPDLVPRTWAGTFSHPGDTGCPTAYEKVVVADLLSGYITPRVLDQRAIRTDTPAVFSCPTPLRM